MFVPFGARSLRLRAPVTRGKVPQLLYHGPRAAYKAAHEPHIRDHHSNYRPGDLTDQTPG